MEFRLNRNQNSRTRQVRENLVKNVKAVLLGARHEIADEDIGQRNGMLKKKLHLD